MSNIKTTVSILSGLVFIFAFIPYIKAIVRKQTRPRKATWLVWAVGDIIILIGMLAKHTVSGLMIGAVLGATTTFILSLKFGEPGWTKRDKICLALSGIAIVLWICFQDSNVGIALSLVGLAIAAWPTYVSAWNTPENEDLKGWILFNTSSILGALAIPHRTFADIAPAVTFVLIDLPMLYLLLIRPRLKTSKTSCVGGGFICISAVI
jgi:hypothetical protein